MNMVAEAEPNQIRLVCIGNQEEHTQTHVRKWLETRPLEDLEIDVEFDVDLTSGLSILESGDADLLAVSALTWHRSQGAPDTRVATAIPRRDTNHILVANDRPSCLPHKSIILASNR